jgi:hypothetical protein
VFLDCLLPMIFCSAVAAVISAGVCFDFSRRSRALSRALNSVVSGELPVRDISNAPELTRRVDAQKDTTLKKLWGRYKTDLDHAFGGAVAPNPRLYFTYDDLFAPSAAESTVSMLWALLPLFCLLTVTVPLGVLFLSHADAGLSDILACLGLSLVSLSFIALLLVLSRRAVAYIREDSSAALSDFNAALSALLPVASESTTAALLLNVTRESAASFRETALLIGKSLNEFTVKRLAPVFSAAFDYSIEKNLSPTLNNLKNQYARLASLLVEKQESGMRELADSFSAHLGASLGERIKAMSETVDTVNERMEALVGAFSVTLESLTRALEAERGTLAEACMRALEAAKLHKDSARTLTGLTAALDKGGALMEKAYERDKRLSAFNSEFAARVEEAVRSISSSLADNRAQLDLLRAQSEETARRYEEFFARADAQNKEFARQTQARLHTLLEDFSAGASDLTEKLRESVLLALERNNEINEAFKAQNDQLKEKYDSYFVKVDASSAGLIAETEFRLQALFTRFSEEAAAVMDRLGKNISDTMNLLESNTGLLLSNLEEQTRSIGLYAKELSLDVSGLSGSLKESVSAFSAQLGESTARTFVEFDKGLAEVTERLSTLTVRISESVENLPKLLEKLP